MPGSSPASSGGVRARAVLHDEQVRGRALGQLAAVVPHHPFERAAPERFLHRQRAVHQVVALDHRVHGAGMIADDVDDGDARRRRDRRSAGGSTCGLTMIDDDGVGVAFGS